MPIRVVQCTRDCEPLSLWAETPVSSFALLPSVFCIGPPPLPQSLVGGGGGVYASPALSLDGATLYAGTYDKQLVALATDSGARVWSTALTGSVLGSPVADRDGLLFVASYSDGRVVAVHSRDGGVLWSHAAGGRVRSSLALGANGWLYFGSYDGLVTALGRR